LFYWLNFICQWEYPLLSLLHGMKALVVAAETYIRINSDGLMCIQHQVLTKFRRFVFSFHMKNHTIESDRFVERQEMLCGLPYGPDSR